MLRVMAWLVGVLVLMMTLIVSVGRAAGALLPAGDILAYGGFSVSVGGRLDRNVFLLDLRVQRTGRMSNDGTLAAHPSWSPDGHTLAYVSSHNGSPVIALNNLFGGTSRVEIDQPTIAFPTWSPTGDKIVFLAPKNTPIFNVFVMDVPPTQPPRAINGTGRFGAPRWSPDGRWLAFEAGLVNNVREIVVTDAAAEFAEALRLHGSNPQWSPDANQLLFISDDEERAGVAILDIAMRSVQVIDPREARSFEPSWSPDGSRVAYVFLDVQGYTLRVVNADGTQPQNFPLGIVHNPTWTLDGQSLLYLDSESNRAHLSLLSVATGAITRLTTAASYEPDGAYEWRPKGTWNAEDDGAGGRRVGDCDDDHRCSGENIRFSERLRYAGIHSTASSTTRS